MNYQEAVAAFRADLPRLEKLGVSFHPGSEPRGYLPEGWGSDINLAMDAQPALSTDPNSGIPWFLANFIDPAIYEVLFSPNKGAEIFGEARRGSWTEQTAMFPIVEHTGEVSSYGDYSENGVAGANANFPQRQNYLFQTMIEYGDLEVERAGLARLNWVGEKNKAASGRLDKFLNLTYHFGVNGLENYGLLNDPNLSRAIAPGPKANGNGNVWIYNGAINASANEVYADIQALFEQVVIQTGGTVEQDAKMTLAMANTSQVAMTATNSFNVNVTDLLKKNFPNLRVETSVLYGAITATNPQGVAAGNTVQLIVDEVEGQDTGFCGFSEKRRSFPIIRRESSYRQKALSGTWGAVIRQPFAIAQMVGV